MKIHGNDLQVVNVTGTEQGEKFIKGATEMAFELQLDLTKHCIETEIKRQHRRAVSDYFRADQFSRQNLEQIIEVTRQALESIDFSHMRSTYPALAGHSDARAFLTIENSRIRIVLAGTTLTPLFKNGLP